MSAEIEDQNIEFNSKQIILFIPYIPVVCLSFALLQINKHRILCIIKSLLETCIPIHVHVVYYKRNIYKF